MHDLVDERSRFKMHSRFRKLIFFFLFIMLTACSSLEENYQIVSDTMTLEPASKSISSDAKYVGKEDQEGIHTFPKSDQAPAQLTTSSGLDGMVAFDGTVLVSTTELSIRLWNEAGWRISDQSLDTNHQEIPLDCTLYPHQGVINQWVGGCAGHVLIPKAGAEDIAVRFTASDGETNIVQVAPEPGYP